MRKRELLILLILSIVLTSNISFSETITQDKVLLSVIEQNNNYKKGITLDKDEYIIVQDKGSLLIKYNPSKDGVYKIWIGKDSVSTSYFIDNNITEVPLSMGPGIYEIKLLKHKKDNLYTIRGKTTIEVKSLRERDIYLVSHEKVSWKSSPKAVKLAEELTKNSKTSKDKIDKIYNYIVQNINYDYIKLNNYPDNYLPNLDDVLFKKKGICYDYASLFAGMLRSIDIPTKLVMGYVKGYDGVFHAWNEVYINGKWVVIDTTFDAGYRELGIQYEMEKVSGDYRGESWY